MNDAREFFERARDAARDLQRMTTTLAAMEANEAGGGSSLGTATSHGSVSNPMDKVITRLDRESVWAIQMQECRDAIDDAMTLLYGTDGRTGLRNCIGSLFAELLYWRYLDSRTVEAVAMLTGISRQTVYRKIDTALDFIDSNGFDNTRAGLNTLN